MIESLLSDDPEGFAGWPVTAAKDYFANPAL
jgi:hypothetical protein